MKTLMWCVVAMTAITTAAKADFASIANIWNTTLFAQKSKRDALPPNSNTQFLLDFTSDRDNSVNLLSAVKDASGNLSGLYSEQSGGAADSKVVFPLSQIESSGGATLITVSGRKAVILSGKVDKTTNEGTFTVKYLTNGLWMNYKTCNFNLKNDAKGLWVQNAYTGAAVSRVHVTTTSMGIVALEGLCPSN